MVNVALVGTTGWSERLVEARFPVRADSPLEKPVLVVGAGSSVRPRCGVVTVASGLIAAMVPWMAGLALDEEESENEAEEPLAVEGAAKGSEAAIVTIKATTRMTHNI